MNRRNAALAGLASLATAFALASPSAPAAAQEVIVMSSVDELIDWLTAENWWGEEKRGEELEVPYAMITGINPRWRTTAQQLSVAQKKEIFYRLMLPLIVHANKMVMDRRTELIRIRSELSAGRRPSEDELAAIRQAAVLLRVVDAAGAEALGSSAGRLDDVIDELLYELDVIPAGLALGQAAYESGYGTSRFAVEGNALFGQWTYGGKGLVPEQQRKQLGDHRIAAYDWPFDSVRGYFINLMSHPAYEHFRRLRAELRANGEPLSSLRLADGLTEYSERGQEYVDTLKSMIRVNHLDIADGATFRDEPMRFLVGAEDEADAVRLRGEIEQRRESGELAEIIARMRLE
jgi:Bax protein